MRHTSVPTSASQNRQSPMKRIPAAKSQWTISACGCIMRLEIGDQRPRDEHREQQPDERSRAAAARATSHQNDCAARMEQRQPVGLQDRPDHARRRDRGADERHDVRDAVIPPRERRRI